MNQEHQRRSRLSTKKLALLKERLRSDFAERTESQTIPRHPPHHKAPLSFAQQRLWFLDRLIPGSPFYNIYNIIRLPYQLNITALERSIQEIARRHEIFRTRFVVDGEEPVQVIDPVPGIPMQIIDLRTTASAQREAEAQRLANEEARRAFDLSRGPLVRTTLLQIDDHDFYFMISMHHIVTDGWSMGIFFRELNTLYEAFAAGKASPLPELPIQYADFALWQHEWLKGDVKAKELRYWKQQLADIPVVQLPTDRPRHKVQTFHGAYEEIAYPAALNAQLKKLSHAEGATLFMTVLAAFITLLFRYTGQMDIVVGSPIAGRNRTELEDLIGFFVNTLVLRTQLSGAMTFRDLLKRVQKVALDAFAHQELPFESLVEELQPERDLSRNPMFQIMFQLMSVPTGGPSDNHTERLPLEVTIDTAKFDLTLSLTDTGGMLGGSLEYNTDLFDQATIARMVSHFRTLLEGLAARPDTPLADLPLLTAEEERQVLVDWNATLSHYPHRETIHRLFEAKAAEVPDADAIVFGDRRMRYDELNRRANQLARHLRKLGVAKEELVGICMERSMDMIVCILGVLKAGGAYLPIDPSYPPKRTACMLADARTRVLLTHQRLREVLPAIQGHTICVDTHGETIASQDHSNLSGSGTAEDLAYVMYTSGSTGTPKGIAIPHRAISRLVLNTNYVDIQPEDRIAHASNCAFDAATFEVWGALLNGAQIIGVPREITLSPLAYAEHIQQHRINVIFMTTALFNQFAQQAPWAFKDVRDLMFGGEAVDPRWVRATLAHDAPRRLLHVYGPTESTTFASWYHVQEVGKDAQTVPIGRPIANTRLYILDAHLSPAPIGIPGELYIGGDGLAREYVNQPRMSAAKFIPDPFSEHPNARLYRTGDLARYRADGCIEFLGRIDQQVKLHGFRIELGDIETALENYPSVREAVVLLREDHPGDKRLSAYLVTDPDRDTPLEALRSYLREHLPNFMIPASFVLLDALPLTPNGKVDRRALPRPVTEAAEERLNFVAPQTRMEKLLASIWQEMLGLEGVGLHDNFFDLGGHSLLMARVHNRIKQVLRRDVSLIDLFKYPTVSTLAHHLDSLAVLPEPQSEDRQRQQRVHERVARQKRAIQMRSAAHHQKRGRKP